MTGHLQTQGGVVPLEKLVVVCSHLRSTCNSNKSPSVKLSSERGVLAVPAEKLGHYGFLKEFSLQYQEPFTMG